MKRRASGRRTPDFDADAAEAGLIVEHLQRALVEYVSRRWGDFVEPHIISGALELFHRSVIFSLADQFPGPWSEKAWIIRDQLAIFARSIEKMLEQL